MKVGEVIKVLKKNGFSLKSQKGSHQKYIKGDKIIIVVYHSRDGEDADPQLVKELNKIIKCK